MTVLKPEFGLGIEESTISQLQIAQNNGSLNSFQVTRGKHQVPTFASSHLQ